ELAPPLVDEALVGEGQGDERPGGANAARVAARCVGPLPGGNRPRVGDEAEIVVVGLAGERLPERRRLDGWPALVEVDGAGVEVVVGRRGRADVARHHERGDDEEGGPARRTTWLVAQQTGG